MSCKVGLECSSVNHSIRLAENSKEKAMKETTCCCPWQNYAPNNIVAIKISAQHRLEEVEKSKSMWIEETLDQGDCQFDSILKQLRRQSSSPP